MDTLLIADVLGIFFTVVGLSMLVNKDGASSALHEAGENKAYLWMWGFLALLIGAWIVAVNNMWTSGLPLVITILGWLALIKGAYILIFPGSAAALYRKSNTTGTLMFAGLIVIVLGLVLLYW